MPAGSYRTLEDRLKGVGTSVLVGAGGQYALPESARLPAGIYTFAVTPPSEPGELSAEGYNATDGKTVERKEGANAITIDFGP